MITQDADDPIPEGVIKQVFRGEEVDLYFTEDMGQENPLVEYERQTKLVEFNRVEAKSKLLTDTVIELIIDVLINKNSAAEEKLINILGIAEAKKAAKKEKLRTIKDATTIEELANIQVQE